MDNKKFASQLKSLRKSDLLNVTQHDLAVILNWKLAQIKTVEGGRKMFRTLMLDDIADKLLTKRGLILDKNAFMNGESQMLSEKKLNDVSTNVKNSTDRRPSGICSNCHVGFYLKDDNEKKDNFCFECGSDMIYFCPSCKTQVSHPNQNYCNHCGTQLRKSI